MTASRRRQILYVVLGLAVVWGIHNYKKPRGRTAPQTTSAPAAALTMPAPQTAISQIDVAANIERPWGSDPFRAQKRTAENRAPAEAPSWKLSGILYNENHPLAVINSRPVGVGDHVDGATVIDINKRNVTLEASGRRFNLTVAAKG